LILAERDGMLDTRAGQCGTDGCVLVVEDDVMLRRAVVKTLHSWGFTIREACDGEVALEQVEDAGDDLRAMLLDIMLPLLDGVAVAERVLVDRPKLPIVACSAALDEEMVARLRAVGVRYFLPKPYSADSLRAMLHTAMAG
jgi:two-component system, cell cycle sensor histidine kinase and response regulator CckA